MVVMPKIFDSQTKNCLQYKFNFHEAERVNSKKSNAPNHDFNFQHNEFMKLHNVFFSNICETLNCFNIWPRLNLDFEIYHCWDSHQVLRAQDSQCLKNLQIMSHLVWIIKMRSAVSLTPSNHHHQCNMIYSKRSISFHFKTLCM